METDVKEDRDRARVMRKIYEGQISHLFALAIHNFRNQMDSVLSGVERLRRAGSRASEKERDHILSNIRDTLLEMSSCLNSMSKSASSNLSRTDRQRVGAREILERAVDIVGPLFERKGITLSLSCERDVSVYCSPEMMVTAVANILLNALESFDDIYKKDKKVIVDAHRNEAVLGITITDNGQGIPGDRLFRVFDPFFTTKTSRRAMGLGLTVAANIVEAHGGRVYVKSKCGEETKVELAVPLDERDYKTSAE